MEQAQAEAKDLWSVASNSQLTKSIEALVRKLGGTPDKSEDSRGLFSRIFSSVTAH
jgi:hypothetical protein